MPAVLLRLATPAWTSSRTMIDRPVVPYVSAAWIRFSMDPPSGPASPAALAGCPAPSPRSARRRDRAMIDLVGRLDWHLKPAAKLTAARPEPTPSFPSRAAARTA